MKSMTARELKNATGDVARALRRGERILLTFRGKPLGTIEPFRSEDENVPSIRPYEQAWAEIEAQLARSKPRFASWRVAERVSRGRR
jgi:antitoxin (DNA-binding transcriptional repressor) of toxin-antitoxin stability system